MDNEEFYRAHELAAASAEKLAQQHVDSLNLPDQINFDLATINPLGSRFVNRADRIYWSLDGDFGETLPYVFGYAVKRMWFSLWDGAYYFSQGIKYGVMGDSDYNRSFTTADGYGLNEGYANTLYNNLSEIKEPAFLASWQESINPRANLTTDRVLHALYLYLLGEAATALKRTEVTSTVNWLFEATDSFALAEGECMWRASREEYLMHEHKNVMSTFARTGADARHASNREAKIKVFSWCDENMSRFKSMDDAAFDIAETFVSQKFRTVREWMTEWNKLRSPGKT